MNDKQGIPFKRLTLEAFAIVGSILLAFAIDAWWEGHQLRDAEAAAMEALRDELVQNREVLRRSIAFNRLSIRSASFFLSASPAQLRQADFSEAQSAALEIENPDAAGELDFRYQLESVETLDTLAPR